MAYHRRRQNTDTWTNQRKPGSGVSLAGSKGNNTVSFWFVRMLRGYSKSSSKVRSIDDVGSFYPFDLSRVLVDRRTIGNLKMQSVYIGIILLRQ